MIRYSDALEGIEAIVDSESPTWRSRATARLHLLRDFGEYKEKYIDPASQEEKSLAPFWSEVKPIFIRRQYNKCIFCETTLEGKSFATVQWDLEHFRPKGSIRPWLPKKEIKTVCVYDDTFPLGDASSKGYFLLAYHLHNYAAACKTCNSPFKSNYFPIAADRITDGNEPADYQAEQPYLVYPLGSYEEDPEALIGFVGAEAVPRYAPDNDLERWRRGGVMIDFFGLNREGLVVKRAEWLRCAVWANLRGVEAGDPYAIAAINLMQSEKAPYTNCARCFVQLFQENPEAASAMIPVLEKIIADTTEV